MDRRHPVIFQRTYSNLPYGNFVLHAVVKDDRGKELSSLSYPFKIERPFYSSWWALIIYFALFFMYTGRISENVYDVDCHA